MHPDKTKFIIFSRSNLTQNVDFVCNNNKEDQNHPENIVKLARVLFSDPTPAIKFLGVFFDPDLNFKYHISSLRKKLSKSLYGLSTVKNTLNQKSLLLLYNSIFHCHLRYAVHIWTCSSSGPINDLFKLQKAADRIISKTSYNSHTELL